MELEWPANGFHQLRKAAPSLRFDKFKMHSRVLVKLHMPLGTPGAGRLSPKVVALTA